MTRLPAAEASFQHDEPEHSPFLHEFSLDNNLDEVTSLKKLIVTLSFSSVYFFEQPLNTEAGLSNENIAPCARSLEDILDTRLVLLCEQDGRSDSLSTFATLFCQAAIMHLWSQCTCGSMSTMAAVAAKLTATLKCLASCSYFKVRHGHHASNNDAYNTPRQS